MKTTKRVRRLLKLADTIERHEDQYDQSSWYCDPSAPSDSCSVAELVGLALEPGELACGTTACIAGWATVLWPDEATALKQKAHVKGDEFFGVSEAAAMLLGYTPGFSEGQDGYEINALFSGSPSWLHDQDTPALSAAQELRRRALELLQGEVTG